jgi:hypothetical protein
MRSNSQSRFQNNNSGEEEGFGKNGNHGGGPSSIDGTGNKNYRKAFKPNIPQPTDSYEQ